MIDIKEIRIGNLFIGYDGNISDWKIQDFSLACTGIELDEIIKSPIQLTEEILLKCGFVNGKDLNWGNPVIDIDGVNWMGSSFDGHIFFNQIKPPCKYLHQLQNLYFALTGTELDTSKLL